MASELESDVRGTADWVKDWLVNFSAGKTQLAIKSLVLLMWKWMGLFLKKNCLLTLPIPISDEENKLKIQRYTNANLKIPLFVWIHIYKYYPENFVLLILRILELFTCKICIFLKIRLLLKAFYCFCMFVIKHFANFTGK